MRLLVADKRCLVLQGQCNCGAVAFEITANITDIYVCHCSICRKATGSNSIPVVVVRNSDFQWLRGEDVIKTWNKPYHDWQTSFCTTCGSNLPGKNDDERMYVPVGLVDAGEEQLQVAHHIWVDSKAPWDVIGDSGKQHPKAFGTAESDADVS